MSLVHGSGSPRAGTRSRPAVFTVRAPRSSPAKRSRATPRGHKSLKSDQAAAATDSHCQETKESTRSEPDRERWCPQPGTPNEPAGDIVLSDLGGSCGRQQIEAAQGGQIQAISLEEEGCAAKVGEMILDQLRRQMETNSDNEWMEVGRDMMKLVEAQALAETLESLGCKYELHQDVLFVSLVGQCDGKNAVEEHLKQVFTVNSFHADNGGNIIVEWPGGRINLDIDTAVYRGDHRRTAVDSRDKPVPIVWVEVAHSNKKEDIDHVRSKFNRGLMDA